MNGDIAKAQKLVHTAMTSIPKYFAPYQPLGELGMWFEHEENTINYSRKLDLSEAIVTVEYDVDCVHIKREYFVSYPHKSLLNRITSDKPISMHLNLSRRPFDSGSKTLPEGLIEMTGFGDSDINFYVVVGAVTNGKKYITGDYICLDNFTETTVGC